MNKTIYLRKEHSIEDCMPDRNGMDIFGYDNASCSGDPIGCWHGGHPNAPNKKTEKLDWPLDIYQIKWLRDLKA